MEQNKLFDGHYFIVKTLSTEGGTADVFLAVDLNTIDTTEWSEEDKYNEDKIREAGMLVAIKQYRPKNALDINGKKCFRDEYKILHNCRHTNILQPNHFSIYNDVPYLELPYCKNGSAETLIGKQLSEQQLWYFIRDVARGLAYIHALNPPIIHQDIKPANVLIDDQGHYAITDFGISVSRASDNNDYMLDEEYSGTMAYMAPERFIENYTPIPQSDIWALGVTLYEILVNNVPFGDYGGDNQLREDTYDALPNSVPSRIRKLIDQCLSADPDKRPTAEQIVQMANNYLKSGSSKNDNTDESHVQQGSGKSKKSSSKGFSIIKKTFFTIVCILGVLFGAFVALVIYFAVEDIDKNKDAQTEQVSKELSNKQPETSPTAKADSIRNIINTNLAKARQQASKGYEHGEGYVHELLLAKKIYKDIQHHQQQLKSLCQNVDDLSDETAKLDSALQGACNEMKQKVEVLNSIGEKEAAKQIEQSLTEVMNAIK